MPGGYVPMYSMRSFDNNKPNLSSSDRTKNLKSKAMYRGAKRRFQARGRCGSNRNVRYYSAGKLRSTKSYEIQRNLARGNVLCEDCNNQGMLCGPKVTRNMLANITMGNNLNSERWGGAFLFFDGGFIRQSQADTVITSDISGTWDLSAATVEDPSKTILPTYGYVNNLFRIPRNLDGNGVVIDPSNALFSDGNCDPFRYLRSSYLKTTMVMRGLLGEELTGSPFRTWLVDCSLNSLIGAFASMRLSGGLLLNRTAGTVKKVCCTPLTVMVSGDPGFSPPTLARIFEVHIELFAYSVEPPPLPEIPYSGSYTSGFSYDPEWVVDIYRPENSGPPHFINSEASMLSRNAEYIHVAQGDCEVGVNLSTKNKTKQSYMYCLGDGTRKINFS